MPRKPKLEKPAEVLAPIPAEILDQIVRDGPLTAEEIETASRRFKKALIERALAAASPSQLFTLDHYPDTRQRHRTDTRQHDRTDIRQCDRTDWRAPYFASGSGLSWKCAASGFVPLPPSISHGARSPLVVHNPRPFHPALGSSMRPSNPLA